MTASSSTSSSGAAPFNIHRAAQEGQIGLLRQYLTSAPESEVASRINERDADQRTPLHWAASTGSEELLSLLIAHGAAESSSPSSNSAVAGEGSAPPASPLEAKDNSGWTPLTIACSAGNAAAVEVLLARGASVHATTPRGLTPLHYAASKGHAEVARRLLAHGADVNARDGAKQVPLHRACSAGHDAVVKVLLKPPPLPSSEDPDAPKQQTREKTRINPQDRLGNTPLHLAMESGHGSTAVLLLEAGVDRERTNSDGQAPEDLDGLGGQAQQRVRDYVRQAYGPRG